MKRIAIVFHSAQGNTALLARHVAQGAGGVPGTTVELLPALEAAAAPDRLLAYDGFIWGSPTYLGGVSAPFKAFMDATGGLWRTQRLRGRAAAGFTVSALPAGDKQTTPVSMFTFSMQHGMVWVGNPFLPEQRQGVPQEQAINRLGSWTGLMAQAGHSGAGAQAFVPGDLRSAVVFGQNFAQAVHRLAAAAPVEELA